MKKSIKRKLKLAKAYKQNKRIPQFVLLRTGNRDKQNPKKRHWRSKSLKIKVK